MTYRKLVTAVAAEFVEDIKASEMGSLPYASSIRSPCLLPPYPNA